MNALIASAGPEGGLFSYDADQVSRLTSTPDVWFCSRNGAGRVISLRGHDNGIVDIHREADGGLVLERSVSSGGGEPCHAVFDPRNPDIAYIVNYGPAAVIELNVRTGASHAIELGTVGSEVIGDRQEASHPHFALFTSDDELLIADLGADVVVGLVRNDDHFERARAWPCPPGSGPRHMARVGGALVITAELAGEVIAAPFPLSAATPAWSHVAATNWQASATTTEGTEVSYPGDIIAIDDQHVTVANRGADTVSIIAVTDGEVSFVSESAAGGRWPQRLATVNGDLVVACRDTDALTVDGTSVASVPRPMWIDPA